MDQKYRVGVLGATGMVGQRFLTLLENHPWFTVTALAASPRSAGRPYAEAIDGRWKLEVPMPDYAKNMPVYAVDQIDLIEEQVDFVFCALNMGKEEIRQLEEQYAKAEIPVVSNNSAHRWTSDVPMVIPEINDDHFSVLEAQKKRLGTKRGFIAVKPNCSIQSYAPILSAWLPFEPYEVLATTYQAISGAGKTFLDWPEMEGNIIPFIGGEEEKSEKEPLRIWGSIQNGQIIPSDRMVITTQCLRVPVLHGHTAAIFVRFRENPSFEDLVNAAEAYAGYPQQEQLPHAPKQFITYLSEDDRPQVAEDVNREEGMGITFGRLRKDSLFDWKFIGLSHNTLRGAAGGALLCAETLAAQGYFST